MIDLEKLKSIYNFGHNLSLSDAQLLIEVAQKQSYNVGEYLIKKGTAKRELFFMLNGLIRSFTINSKGDEITGSISWENQFVANPDIISFNQPSRFYYEALEPTEVLLLDYDLLESIIVENPKLLDSRKYIFLNFLKGALKRVESFVLLSPEERYIEFVDSYNK